jgi:transposase
MYKTRGASRMFNENEIKQLEKNPNVENVTEKGITYSATFKLAAVRHMKKVKPPWKFSFERGLT